MVSAIIKRIFHPKQYKLNVEENIKKIDAIILKFKQIKPKLERLEQQLAEESKYSKECPKCHSKKIAKIVYGFIDPSAYEEDDEKFIYCPGCIVEPFLPIYHCRKCGKEWGIDYTDVQDYIIHIIEKHLKTYENLKKLTFDEMQELLKGLVSLKDELIKDSVDIEPLREIING